MKLLSIKYAAGSRRWIRAVQGVAVLAAVATLAVACGGDNSGGTGTASSAQVTTSTKAGLGPILVDSAGKALYFADEESAGSIVCTGECTGFWRPLTTPGDVAPQASADLTQALSMVRRPDGKMQVAYDSHPLYSFKLDKSADQAKGNDVTDDFGGKTFNWHAITPAGVAPSQASSQPSSPSYQGGY